MVYEISGVIEGKEQQGGLKKDGNKWTRTSYTIAGKKYSTFDTTDYEIGEEVKLKVEDKTLDTGAIVHNITEIVKKDEKFARNDDITSEDKDINITPEQTVLHSIDLGIKRIVTALEMIAHHLQQKKADEPQDVTEEVVR